MGKQAPNDFEYSTEIDETVGCHNSSFNPF